MSYMSLLINKMESWIVDTDFIELRTIAVWKSCPQVALDTMICLTPLDLYVKQCAAHSCHTSKVFALLKTALDRTLQSSEGRLFWGEVRNFTKSHRLFCAYSCLVWGYLFQIWHYGLVGRSWGRKVYPPLQMGQSEVMLLVVEFSVENSVLNST